jgi:serine O-acetyltransferase
MLDNLRRDAKRYAGYGGWWRSPGFWVGALYRTSVSAHKCPLPGLRQLFILLSWMLKFPFKLLFHVELPSCAKIGPGLLMVHPFNILVGNGVEIGEECSLFHEVTLGPGAPPNILRIGDNVVIFPGARVLGGIKVGHHSEIGANCVVTKDVAPFTLVVPPIAHNIPRELMRASAAPSERSGDEESKQ